MTTAILDENLSLHIEKTALPTQQSVSPYIGWRRLVGRFLYLPLLLSALPFVLLLRMIRPWILLRLVKLDASHLGHFWTPELYLCEQETGLLRRQTRTLDLFYTTKPAVSPFLLRTWKQLIPLFPQNKFLEMIDYLNRWLPGYEIHVLTLRNQTGDLEDVAKTNHRLVTMKPPQAYVFYQNSGVGLLIKTKPHIRFSREEDQKARACFERMGLPSSVPIICFHARDKAYKKMVDPTQDFSYHDYRDADIHNYMLMAEEFSMKAYYMIRMGAVVAEPLQTCNPRIIDYGSKYRSELMDFYLIAHCRFFVASQSGINVIPTLFRCPTVVANKVPYEYLYSWTEHDLFIPKKLWSRSEKRFFTLREVLKRGYDRYHQSRLYEQEGIDVIENSPQEILDASLEMEARLNGTWETTREDENLQNQFWSIFNSDKPRNVRLSRMGAKFLRENNQIFAQ